MQHLAETATPPAPQRPLAALGIFFPFVIFGLHRLGAPYYVELCVAFLALLAHFERARPWKSFALIAGAAALAGPVFVVKPENLARLYPFVVSFASLSAFYASSRDGGDILATFAERFAAQVARFGGKRLSRRFAAIDPEKRLNLRAAVPLWVVGLSVNTLILFLFLFWGSDSAWLSYAGFASYLLLLGLGVATVARVATGTRRRAQHAS